MRRSFHGADAIVACIERNRLLHCDREKHSFGRDGQEIPSPLSLATRTEKREFLFQVHDKHFAIYILLDKGTS